MRSAVVERDADAAMMKPEGSFEHAQCVHVRVDPSLGGGSIIGTKLIFHFLDKPLVLARSSVGEGPPHV